MAIVATMTIPKDGAGFTWAQARPFSFRLLAVVLEFEIRSKLARNVIATEIAAHDDLICLPDHG
jgi:hypothetical protein